MKNQNTELYTSIFAGFTLSNEEMICVRGGTIDEDPTIKPGTPPVII